MDKEYNKNQKYQRRSFSKYRKYIRKIFLWGGLAVASAFLFPGTAVLGFFKGLLGDYLGVSATFFTQWGIAGIGAIGAITNVLKANHERKKIDNAQDDEENIIDSMLVENDELKRKVESLEKSKSKVKESDETYTRTISEKEKDLTTNNLSNDEIKEKKYVK